MLKLLLCTAIISPCLIVPFVSASDDTKPDFGKDSFEEAFIAPEFEKLESCETAELDVFFHKQYITFHSAEYVAQGLELTADCGSAKYTITPVVPSISYVDKEVVIDVHTQELLLILEAHGVTAQVGDAVFQKDFNSLTANGRTAKLTIAFGESVSS